MRTRGRRLRDFLKGSEMGSRAGSGGGTRRDLRLEKQQTSQQQFMMSSIMPRPMMVMMAARHTVSLRRRRGGIKRCAQPSRLGAALRHRRLFRFTVAATLSSSTQHATATHMFPCTHVTHLQWACSELRPFRGGCCIGLHLGTGSPFSPCFDGRKPKSSYRPANNPRWTAFQWIALSS